MATDWRSELTVEIEKTREEWSQELVPYQEDRRKEIPIDVGIVDQEKLGTIVGTGVNDVEFCGAPPGTLAIARREEFADNTRVFFALRERHWGLIYDPHKRDWVMGLRGGRPQHSRVDFNEFFP